MCIDIAIKDIFVIVDSDIIKMAKQGEVDTIVNSANPTLMKGIGLDAVVHQAVNQGKESEFFNCKIREEIDECVEYVNNIIRCEEGQAKKTSGYQLCRNIIHTVGPYFDKTNSSMQKLEDCYKNILKIAFESKDIRKIAIPVISARSKDFSYNEAVKIAIISINNYLVKLKRKNPHHLLNIEKIYLVIFMHPLKFPKIKSNFEIIVKKEEQLHYRTSVQAQIAYFYEIKKNDTPKRGYFAIAKWFRYFLVLVRFLYFPEMFVREKMRNKSWECGKKWIEFEVMIQTCIPVIAIVAFNYIQISIIKNILYVLIGYVLLDVITYLLGLIFLADIQKPSANVTRSVLLIGINYITSILCVTFYYYVFYLEKGEWAALNFALLGTVTSDTFMLLVYLQKSVNFLFMTLIISFFIGHLKQRSFS